MSKIEVTKIVFDTKTEQPELILKDGSTRVLMFVPTGSCWMGYWVTPEYRDEIDRWETSNKEAPTSRCYICGTTDENHRPNEADVYGKVHADHKILSSCHQAALEIVKGDDIGLMFSYYICSYCGKPCNINDVNNRKEGE